MKLKTIANSLVIVAVMAMASACSRSVTRVDPGQQIDISGAWNNTDSRQVAAAMTGDVLNANWLINHLTANNGNKPVVIVGFVQNKSHEHIEAETFTKDVEQSFIQSQKVRLVQGGKKREELRGERADQQVNSSTSTMKKFGLENGADYMLQGTINSIVDALNRKKVVYYQVNLELTNLQTGEIVWIGDKKIAKYVKN